MVSSLFIGEIFDASILLLRRPESRDAKLVWRFPSRLPVVRKSPHTTISMIIDAATLRGVGMDMIFDS